MQDSQPMSSGPVDAQLGSRAPCRVQQCSRPAGARSHGLCQTHAYQCGKLLRLPVEEFLAHPQTEPLSDCGECEAAVCARRREGPESLYCRQHQWRLGAAKREGRFDGDERAWRLAVPAVPVDREASLRGLPDLVVAELLHGMQTRTVDGVRTLQGTVRACSDRLRAHRVQSLETMPEERLAALDLADLARGLVTSSRTAARRLGATPESERHKDVWDLAVFGHRGRLDFTRIHQRSLREAAKVWAYDELPRRRGSQVRASMQAPLAAMVMLSESLRLQRDDLGEHLGLLGRSDIVAFCNRLGFLADTGKISANYRHDSVKSVRRVLNRLRTIGLTRPGEILAGMPADFALSAQDIPDEPEDTEAGKDLPDEVLRQLCENLDLLEQAYSREVRVSTELLIDTGRRPDEIRPSLAGLPDHRPGRLPRPAVRQPQGLPSRPAPAHRQGHSRPDRRPAGTGARPLPERLGRRAEAAAWPPAQSARHQADRPAPGPAPRLGRLLARHPGPCHRRGRRQASDEDAAVRQGQDLPLRLPALLNAQRHADAGAAPDVLQALMDHRHLSTTQSYYRVGQKRRRAAVDRVTALQFDRHGQRVWRKVQSLLDSEHVRRAIGEVATAYGTCQEPSNVAAGGHSCPIRFRCVGCDHFRTDVSYLPDLERYLADLLRSRERLMSAFEADDWARSEAMPSEEEIRRLRRLINRVKADLDDLTLEDRAQVEDAVAVVRRGRTVTMLGLPKVRQPLPDVRPWRSE
ncbi:hypothetical protein ACIPJK_37350 [Streptomyces roseus]|uniref:hypothetical protein n=1 Tax=Streptomyces roseus TaxID=66430 RepID=UPI0037FC2FD1